MEQQQSTQGASDRDASKCVSKHRVSRLGRSGRASQALVDVRAGLHRYSIASFYDTLIRVT